MSLHKHLIKTTTIQRVLDTQSLVLSILKFNIHKVQTLVINIYYYTHIHTGWTLKSQQVCELGQDEFIFAVPEAMYYQVQ